MVVWCFHRVSSVWVFWILTRIFSIIKQSTSPIVLRILECSRFLSRFDSPKILQRFEPLTLPVFSFFQFWNIFRFYFLWKFKDPQIHKGLFSVFHIRFDYSWVVVLRDCRFRLLEQLSKVWFYTWYVGDFVDVSFVQILRFLILFNFRIYTIHSKSGLKFFTLDVGFCDLIFLGLFNELLLKFP